MLAVDAGSWCNGAWSRPILRASDLQTVQQLLAYSTELLLQNQSALVLKVPSI